MMKADLDYLCSTIGERLAGTEAENSAASYIADTLRSAGCGEVAIERFPCRSRRDAVAEVTAIVHDGVLAEEATLEAAAVTGSGSTAGEVEGDAVWIEMPEQAGRLQPAALRGRIAVIFGPLPENLDHHKRLVAASPLAVIHVDHRLPFGWPKADGTYPKWVRDHGFPPTVTIPYTDAWRLRASGHQLRFRVRCEQTMIDAESTNVRADLAGSDPSAGTIVVSAHHDTQAGNVGADDNASGVVVMLEVARRLAARAEDGGTFARTVRFLSFGAEEQLSVGSAAYVRAHRGELDRVGLVCNLDSVSSPMGHHVLVTAGTEPFITSVSDRFGQVDFHPQIERAAMPFADHFPFSAFGVPAFTMIRTNFPGGRWQHHSVHDFPGNVSLAVMDDVASAVEHLVASLAREASPSAVDRRAAVAEELDDQTRTLANDLYGLFD